MLLKAGFTPLPLIFYVYDPLRFPLTFSLNFPEHLNVTTRLAGRVATSPVAGFRPFRSPFLINFDFRIQGYI